MKNTQDRVFAYTQAKNVTVNELQTIAGGKSNSVCYEPSLFPTGSNMNSLDASIDMTIDW